MNLTPSPPTDMPEPDNQRSGLNGQRGRTLKRQALARGVGQRCLARFLGVPQSGLSVVLAEKFGGLPRGFSRRYEAAMIEIIGADVARCQKGCGCSKCPGCGHRRFPTSKYCGGLACAREFEQAHHFDTAGRDRE